MAYVTYVLDADATEICFAISSDRFRRCGNWGITRRFQPRRFFHWLLCLFGLAQDSDSIRAGHVIYVTIDCWLSSWSLIHPEKIRKDDDSFDMFVFVKHPRLWNLWRGSREEHQEHSSLVPDGLRGPWLQQLPAEVPQDLHQHVGLSASRHLSWVKPIAKIKVLLYLKISWCKPVHFSLRRENLLPPLFVVLGSATIFSMLCLAGLNTNVFFFFFFFFSSNDLLSEDDVMTIHEAEGDASQDPWKQHSGQTFTSSDWLCMWTLHPAWDSLRVFPFDTGHASWDAKEGSPMVRIMAAMGVGHQKTWPYQTSSLIFTPLFHFWADPNTEKPHQFGSLAEALEVLLCIFSFRGSGRKLGAGEWCGELQSVAGVILLKKSRHPTGDRGTILDFQLWLKPIELHRMLFEQFLHNDNAVSIFQHLAVMNSIG